MRSPTRIGTTVVCAEGKRSDAPGRRCPRGTCKILVTSCVATFPPKSVRSANVSRDKSQHRNRLMILASEVVASAIRNCIQDRDASRDQARSDRNLRRRGSEPYLTDGGRTLLLFCRVIFPGPNSSVCDCGVPARARPIQPGAEHDGATVAAGHNGACPESFVGRSHSQQRNVPFPWSLGNALDVFGRILGSH